MSFRRCGTTASRGTVDTTTRGDARSTLRDREPAVTLERSSPRAKTSRSASLERSVVAIGFETQCEKQDGTRSFGSPVHGPSGLTRRSSPGEAGA